MQREARQIESGFLITRILLGLRDRPDAGGFESLAQRRKIIPTLARAVVRELAAVLRFCKLAMAASASCVRPAKRPEQRSARSAS